MPSQMCLCIFVMFELTENIDYIRGEQRVAANGSTLAHRFISQVVLWYC